jgi:hypothetical protein
MRNETEIASRFPPVNHPLQADPQRSGGGPADPTVDPSALVDRYVAMWMEPDPPERRRRIHEVWAPGGGQVLEPPQAVRDSARFLGFLHPALEVRGYGPLEFRVTRAYDEYIAPGRFAFRRSGDAVRVGDAVKFRWEMRSLEDGSVAAAGLDLLLLDAEGRIRVDYQFVER